MTWAAGDASAKTFSIAIVDDGYAEGDETFTIGLNSPSGATLGAQSTATVTIQDNEGVSNGANPIDHTNFFVRQQYIDFLGREPDPARIRRLDQRPSTTARATLRNAIGYTSRNSSSNRQSFSTAVISSTDSIRWPLAGSLTTQSSCLTWRA